MSIIRFSPASTRTVIVLIAALLVAPGCVRLNCCQQLPTVATVNGSGSEWVFLWIAGYRDTSLDTALPNPAAGCDPELRVGQFVESVRRTYVDFMLPQLPAGSQVTEAYLNLYHPARRGDGTTDNINISVQRTSDNWEACPTPASLTFSPGFDFNLDLRSQDWSGSEDIHVLINDLIANPTGFEGFMLHHLSGGGIPVQKSFYSDNHQSRTRNDLGLSPRLLLRVQLPPGLDASAITLPQLPGNNDLGDVRRRPGPPQWLAFLFPPPPANVRMMEIEQATASSPWPPAWAVAIAGVP